MGKRGLWTLTWNLQCPGASRRPPAANGDFGEVEQRGRRTGAGRERGVGSHLPAESRFSGMPSGRQLPGPAVGDRRAPCGPAGAARYRAPAVAVELDNARLGWGWRPGYGRYCGDRRARERGNAAARLRRSGRSHPGPGVLSGATYLVRRL